MTNKIEPGKGVPYSKVQQPPKKEVPVSKAVKGVFEDKKQPKIVKPQNKAWSMKGAALKWYMDTLKSPEDQKVLKNIFGDTSLLDAEISEQAPFLRDFFTEAVKNAGVLGEAFRENPEDVEEFSDHLIHHIILSVALKTLPPDVQKKVKNGVPLSDPLNVQEVLAKFIKQTVEVFGKDFNEIDKQAMKGEPLNELFRPLLDKVFDYVFPEGDTFRTLVDSLSFPDRIGGLFSFKKENILDSRTFKQKVFDGFSVKLAGLYQPLIGGEKLQKIESKPPLPGQKETMEWLGNFVMGAMISTSKNEDIEFFKSRGIQDPEYLTKQISPAASEYLLKFLPIQKELAIEGTDAALLHILASVLKASGKNPLNPDTLIEDVFSHLAGIVREGMASQDRSKPVDATSFTPTTQKLMSLFLPPNSQWALDFMKRRENGQIASLNQLFLQMYEAEVGGREVKERLLRRLGNQESVDQLDALCNALTSKFLIEFDKFLSDPEKLGKVLKGENETTDLIIKIFSSKDPQLQWLGNNMSKTGGLVLLSGLTHFLEKIPNEKGESFEDLSFAAFEAILGIGSAHLPEASAQLRSNHEEEGNKILLSFVKELTSLFYTPEKLEKQGAAAGIGLEKVQEYVAKELAKAINYSNKLLGAKKDNQEKLEALYGSDNPAKMGDILRHAVLQGIPSALNVEAPFIAEKIVPRITAIALNGDQKTAIQDGIVRTLNKIGSEKLLENAHVMEYFSQFAEAGYLQFLLNFSEGVQKLEKQGEGPRLVEEMVLIAMNGLSDHFKNLGGVKEILKGTNPTTEQIYEQLEKMEVLAPELKNPAARKDFYEKLASQLFLLFEADLKKELPDIAANMIENVIAPSILSLVFTAALDPATLHIVLSNLLKNAADSSKAGKIEFSTLFPSSAEIQRRLDDKRAKRGRSKEQYQKDITIVLSELIKNFATLQPSSVARKVGDNGALRKGITEGFADTICKILREGDKKNMSQVLFLMDKGMGVLLDAYPSELDPVTGKYEYVSGDMKTESPSFKLIHQTIESKEKAKAKKEEDVKRAMKNVPRFLKRHIHLIASAFILDGFFGLWDKMEGKIKTALPRLSIIINPLLQAFIKLPLFIVLFLFNILVSAIVRAIVRILFHESADYIAENVKHATPENFVYNSFWDLMESIDRRRGKVA